MSFLAPILGGALSGAGGALGGGANPVTGLIGAAASALQPGPSNASRASADYNPVTVINAPGSPDLNSIGQLIATINASGQKAQANNLAYQLATGAGGADPGVSISGANWTLIALAGVGILGVLIWLRYR